MVQSTWQDIAARKQAERKSRIPQAWVISKQYLPKPGQTDLRDIPRKCGVLSSQELQLTEQHDATDLVSLMASGKLKSKDVVTAFCKRAAVAQQLTNCLTEIMFEDAIQRAEELDQYLSEHGKPIGPLHGLPISVKDTFKIKGYDACIGIAALAFKPATNTAVLVKLLQDAGAIIHCKTNIPQTLMTLDSHNNVFGRVLNPLNTRLTAGGSTGGEAALIGMRGSVLGVGTDVGGSIRIPAMCEGLYGFKSSWQRVPYSGQEGGQAPGMSKIGLPASAGPLAASLRDCELLLKTIADARPWEVDADVCYGLWQDQGSCSTEGREAVIGIVKRDGLVDPLPPIVKLLDEVKSSLRKSGVKVIELDITPAFSKCQSLANQFFGVHGNNFMLDLLDQTGEPLSPWLTNRLRRKPFMTGEKIQDIHGKREELRKEFLKIWTAKDETGKEVQIDAIVLPVAPHPVPLIDRYNSVSYTSSFVLLDYPAGTVPVRTMKPADLEGDVPKSDPLNGWDKINRELWTSVDKTAYLESPLCVQVVGPRMQERKLYQAMALIDNALKSDLSSANAKI